MALAEGERLSWSLGQTVKDMGCVLRSGGYVQWGWS